jgi:formylglycine-generating enzyme required for sulfatase activity
MALVPAGLFMMGRGRGRVEDHEPQHRVFVSAYYIDVYEVTNERFNSFLKETGRRERDLVRAADEGDLDRGMHPVVNVTWSEACSYCAWAAKRLPTEAEWERAAQADRGEAPRPAPYPWGFTSPRLARYANLRDVSRDRKDIDGVIPPGLQASSRKMVNHVDDQYAFTAPVGSFALGASGYGVHDMVGNVREWTRDRYEARFYDDSSPVIKDPVGPSGPGPRVVRGTSYKDNPDKKVETYRRDREAAGARHANLGFRCAISVAELGRAGSPDTCKDAR